MCRFALGKLLRISYCAKDRSLPTIVSLEHNPKRYFFQCDTYAYLTCIRLSLLRATSRKGTDVSLSFSEEQPVLT